MGGLFEEIGLVGRHAIDEIGQFRLEMAALKDRGGVMIDRGEAERAPAGAAALQPSCVC